MVEPADPDFPVWPENWDAARLFLASGTQWRHAGMAGLPVALDYAGVRVAADALGLVLDEPLFAQLRVMEAAAASVFLDRART